MFDDPLYIAIYHVKNEKSWPLWSSVAGSVQSCQSLYNYWHNDLPENMKRDRKLVDIIRITVKEVSTW